MANKREQTKIRPYTRYEDQPERHPVMIRTEQSTKRRLDDLAKALNSSRAHVADLILKVALNELYEDFHQAVMDRMREAWKKRFVDGVDPEEALSEVVQ